MNQGFYYYISLYVFIIIIDYYYNILGLFLWSFNGVFFYSGQTWSLETLFHKSKDFSKILIVCFSEETISYGFETTWG